jgi:hypothetical protein
VGVGTVQKPLLVQVSDAGGGSGLWSVTVDAQAATAGASLAVPGAVTVAPGGTVDFPLAAVATPSAKQGENYGFVVLQKGGQTRRIPYLFYVDRPALAGATVKPIHGFVAGDTSKGTSLVNAYRFPVAPFGFQPERPAMQEDGAEQVYSLDLNRPVANAGVSTILQGGYVDPFFLGSLDESTVQGYAGTPIDVNGLTFDYGLPVSAAGAEFPRVQRFYVSVDSGRDPLTGQSFAGPYILHSWTNDVTPPSLRLLTRTVSTGRPTIVVRTQDRQSGVDPNSLVIGYHGVLVGPAAYDPISGLAIFPLPNAAPKLSRGRRPMLFSSSDFQETKNIDTTGSNLLPNTRTRASRLHVVNGPEDTWLLPSSGACVKRGAELLVTADAPKGIKGLRFLLDGRKLAKGKRGPAHLWTAKLGKLHKGRHVLEAVAATRGGSAKARIRVHTCGAK